MARPKGFRISRPAFQDILEARRMTMTEMAASAGMPLATLSGLVAGAHRASMATVRKLAAGAGCSEETLFPELLFPELREVA